MEDAPRRKQIWLREKKTGKTLDLSFVQYDSIQGYWCIDCYGNWDWYPHEEWEKIKLGETK